MSKVKPHYRLKPLAGAGRKPGPVKFMAAIDGYVMVRRPGCYPFVVDIRMWDVWTICDRHGSPLGIDKPK